MLDYHVTLHYHVLNRICPSYNALYHMISACTCKGMCTSVQEHPSARDRRTATWQMEILPLGATDVHPHSPPGIGLKIKECGKVGVDIVSGGILIFRYATSIAMMTLAKRERDESRQKKRSAKMKIGKTEIWRK